MLDNVIFDKVDELRWTVKAVSKYIPGLVALSHFDLECSLDSFEKVFKEFERDRNEITKIVNEINKRISEIREQED